MSVSPISSPGVWSPPATSAPSAASSGVQTSADSGASDVQWFTDYMAKTPAQHMRDSILQSLGYTEDDLKKMDPKKRQAVEDEITKRLKDQALHKTDAQQKAGVLMDITA